MNLVKLTMREEKHALDTKEYREKPPLRALIDFFEQNPSLS